MKISIVGAAGYVGSNVAILLAAQGLGDEIVLIDPFKPNLVTHLGMDASTAFASKNVVLHDGQYEDMKDSNIVFVAAGAAQGLIASRMEMLPKNLPIIKDIADNIKRFCPDAIVLTATNPVDPLNYAMYLCTGFDRRKVIGYTVNDSLRFRMMVAESLGHKTGDITGFVFGEHGESQLLGFSTVKVNGNPVVFSEADKKNIINRIPLILKTYEELQTGRTAGVTSGYGATLLIKAIVNNTNETWPSSGILDGEYGLKNISMGVPLVLGSGGIHEIKEWELAPDEKPGFDNTVKVLSAAMRQVEEFVKSAK
jgi:malate dehydrogenase